MAERPASTAALRSWKTLPGDELDRKLRCLGLVLDREAKVTICIECEHALRPSDAVSKHLADQHETTAKPRHGLGASVKQLQLPNPSEPRPRPDDLALFLSMLMNSVEITDGSYSQVSQRIGWCKRLIRQRGTPIDCLTSISSCRIVRSVAFHDVLSTKSMIEGDITVDQRWWTATDTVDTMMGTFQPIFFLVGKIGQLSSIRRNIIRHKNMDNDETNNLYLEAKFLEGALDSLVGPAVSGKSVTSTLRLC